LASHSLIDLAILKEVERRLRQCVEREAECGRARAESLLKVGLLIMDKRAGTFPSERYDGETIALYLSLRRRFRAQRLSAKRSLRGATRLMGK